MFYSIEKEFQKLFIHKRLFVLLSLITFQEITLIKSGIFWYIKKYWRNQKIWQLNFWAKKKYKDKKFMHFVDMTLNYNTIWSLMRCLVIDGIISVDYSLSSELHELA